MYEMEMFLTEVEINIICSQKDKNIEIFKNILQIYSEILQKKFHENIIPRLKKLQQV